MKRVEGGDVLRRRPAEYPLEHSSRLPGMPDPTFPVQFLDAVSHCTTSLPISPAVELALGSREPTTLGRDVAQTHAGRLDRAVDAAGRGMRRQERGREEGR